MEELLLKLLERRATARLVCAGGTIFFVVLAIVSFLACYHVAEANRLLPRHFSSHYSFDAISLERMFEYGIFYSLGLAALFALGLIWSLTRIPFPRMGWRRWLLVASCLALGAFLLLSDQNDMVWSMWKYYPLSAATSCLLLMLGAILCCWLIKLRKRPALQARLESLHEH